MSAVFLAPHHDDETLFGAFTILRAKPKVVIVLESHLQERRGNAWGGAPITNALRQFETLDALHHLGDEDVEFWPFRDDEPDWYGVADRVGKIEGHVFAPAPYDGGHDHHNTLGYMVREAIPAERRTLYSTYTRGTPDHRVQGRIPVSFDPAWVEFKLSALACHRSQIALWPHHFLGDQREWYEE